MASAEVADVSAEPTKDQKGKEEQKEPELTKEQEEQKGEEQKEPELTKEQELKKKLVAWRLLVTITRVYSQKT